MVIIKDLRTQNNFTQEQIATAISVSRPTYAAIESGKQPLGIEEAKKLAGFYSIDIDSLLAGRIPDIEKYKHMILSYLRMKGYRSRNGHGPLRAKRSDTLVENIEKQYGADFDVRGDMELGTLLKERGVSSLNDLLHHSK